MKQEEHWHLGDDLPSWDELNVYEHDVVARCPGEVLVVLTTANEEEFRKAYIEWDKRVARGDSDNLDGVLMEMGHFAVSASKGEEPLLRTATIDTSVTLKLDSTEVNLIVEVLEDYSGRRGAPPGCILASEIVQRLKKGNEPAKEDQAQNLELEHLSDDELKAEIGRRGIV